jgi:hypothetical protein
VCTQLQAWLLLVPWGLRPASRAAGEQQSKAQVWLIRPRAVACTVPAGPGNVCSLADTAQ